MEPADAERPLTEWDLDLLALHTRLGPLELVDAPISLDALAPLPADTSFQPEAWPRASWPSEPDVQLDDPTEPLAILADAKVAGEDGKAALLHKDAYALYQTANDAYKATVGHTFPFIQINQSVRSTSEQARLYEAYYKYLYYDGPVANPANQPGKSFHEYGFAIDVIRGGDEALLRPALEDAGWESINADEGWHFEARSTASFSVVQMAIQSQVVPLALRYIGELDASLKLKKQYNDEGPLVLAEEQRLRTEEAALRTLDQSLVARKQDLERRRASLQQQNTNLNQLAGRINTATQAYNSMTYDLCPNHEPYESCTHTDLKNQWLAQKKAAYENLMRLRSQYDADKQRYQQEYAQYNRDVPILAQDRSAYQRRYQTFQQDQVKGRQARVKLNLMLNQSQQHRNTATTLVGSLANLVNTIRQGL